MRAFALPGESAAGAGLVSVSTTHTAGGGFIVIDPEKARFTRLQKNIGVAAKLHQHAIVGAGRQHIVMVTLTYARDDGWAPEHVRQYLTSVRNWLARSHGHTLRYVWVAEDQDGSRRTDGGARHVIHYHVYFWLPVRVFMPKADKRGWWPHGSTRTEKVRASVAYVMSYAKKLKSKKGLPHGARVYGVGGLDAAARGVRRWLNYPAFIQARADCAERYGPAAGGGFINRATGEWWPAEYRVHGLSFLAGGRSSVLVRVHDHGRPVADVAGPYSWNPHVLH